MSGYPAAVVLADLVLKNASVGNVPDATARRAMDAACRN